MVGGKHTPSINSYSLATEEACSGFAAAVSGDESTICLLKDVADGLNTVLIFLHVDIGDCLVLRVVEFCCEKPKLS